MDRRRPSPKSPSSKTFSLRDLEEALRVPPLTEDQVERFRQQLGDAKPGDYVETDFMVGFLPDFSDFPKDEYQ